MTRPISVLILVFLGLSVLDARCTRQTDKHQTDVRRASSLIAAALCGRGHNNNDRIYIAPYGRKFRGAAGRSDQCSVKAGENEKLQV